MKKIMRNCFVWLLVFPVPAIVQAQDYIVLAWNDLGMHCYNADFQDLAVLPPFNTLWAQVVRTGNPPRIITGGVTVTYSFPDNTTSSGKTNFWDYEQALFGVNLTQDIGLAGKGLSGTMDPAGSYFVAEGIPLTEYRDSDTVKPYPYQRATIEVRETASGALLASIIAVAPVSTEMRCDLCHSDGDIDEIATGRVESNILTLHDNEHLEEYPSGHTGALMNRRPVLCAECHSSNALNAAGVSGVPSLSNAMHEKHSDKVTQSTAGCYNCHPGPQTQCLRGVMSQEHAMGCIDCHGGMETVSQNSSPWLNEPRCDNAACHGADYAQDMPLYRLSRGHGGLYCEACHDSPHAVAPSREEGDALKFVAIQGYAGTLDKCTVCHETQPAGSFTHRIPVPGAPITGISILLLSD